MTGKTAKTYANAEITSLPTAERHGAAVRKYADAVELYKKSNTPIREIAARYGLTPSGLSAYIARHHRDLLLKKYGIATLDSALCIKKREGQSVHTYKKYRTAIRACSDMAYIEFNISQIAVMFGHDAPALASQLRFHYPDVIPERERMRQNLGIADNFHRGVRPDCEEAYAEAVAMYRDTDKTVREVAEACDVSPGGLAQHLQFYHKSVVGEKAARRDACVNNTDAERAGTLSGNGRLYGPKLETVAKYAKAMELYRTSPMTLKEIAAAAGVPYAGFRSYLRLWHRDEMAERPVSDSTAAKYSPAIESLRENPRSVAKVAAEFGLNPEVFREYLQRHAPELTAFRGMAKRDDGKLTRRTSAEKYAKAIEEYATSAQSLKDIAERHGLVYNSLSAYVRRNCRAEIESHRKRAAAI